MNTTLLNNTEKRNFLILDVALALAVDNMNHFLDLDKMEVVHLDEHGDSVQEIWESIENQPEKYLQILTDINEKAYHIMQDFVGKALADDGDESLKTALTTALTQARPFAKFRYVLDDKPDYLAKWYLFRDDCYKKQAQNWLVSHGLLAE